MTTTLKGRTALVTGSTGGIGEAFVRAFAEAGANIVLNGFADAAAIETLTAELKKNGVDVMYHGADVGKPNEIEDMIKAAQSRFGAIDILVNNAVTRHYAPIEDFPVDKWERALAVNLSSCFHTIRLALPEMKRRNWGRIINMASIHATKVVRDRVDYIATKHAIVGLTRGVALETATTGVTCNSISPGLVMTPHAQNMVKRKMDERGMTREKAVAELLEARQPSRRGIPPAEVGAMGVYLCSDAAANVTGANLAIDGAWAISCD